MTGEDMHQEYSVILEWDSRGEIYVVTVPELPGCRTHGKTREEAVKQAKDAIQSWIEDAVASGDPIPQPRLHAVSAQELRKQWANRANAPTESYS